MRFLLTGGVGYLGGRMTQYLRSRGHHVKVTTRRAANEIPAWFAADQVVRWDEDRLEAIDSALDDTDALIHLASPDANTAFAHPVRSLQATASLTWNLMDAVARRDRSPLVVYMSTFHVYGSGKSGVIREDERPQPVHPYGLGKWFGEEIVQLFRRQRKAKALSIRLSNAFGAPVGPDISQWYLVFNDLCRQAVTEGVLRLKSSGQQTRNFVTLADTVRAIEFIAERPEQWPADGVIHLGSTLDYRILDVARLVASLAATTLGKTPEIVTAAPTNETPSPPVKFSIERLTAMGFAWTNDAAAEVDGTLRLCLQHREQLMARS